MLDYMCNLFVCSSVQKCARFPQFDCSEMHPDFGVRDLAGRARQDQNF